MVNGGGAVTLQFQRNPYRPEMRTVWAAWNRIVVLDDVSLRLGDDSAVSSLGRRMDITVRDKGAGDYSDGVNAGSCLVEQLEMMRVDVVEAQDAHFDASDGRATLLFADKQVNRITACSPQFYWQFQHLIISGLNLIHFSD